jgi:hypothetical protein
MINKVETNNTNQKVIVGKIKCPNCGSYKTQARRDGWKNLLLLGLATSWIVGIGLIFVILSPLVWLVAKFMPNVVMCQDCHYKFTSED